MSPVSVFDTKYKIGEDIGTNQENSLAVSIVELDATKQDNKIGDNKDKTKGL